MPGAGDQQPVLAPVVNYACDKNEGLLRIRPTESTPSRWYPRYPRRLVLLYLSIAYILLGNQDEQFGSPQARYAI